MTELLQKIADRPAIDLPDGLHQAAVLLVEGRACTVEIDGLALPARRAAGCLLAPEPGDLVLLSVAEGGAYVLSVLERAAADRPGTLDHAAGLAIEASAGDVTLRAAGTVGLIGGETVHLAGRDLLMQAHTASLTAERSFVRSQDTTLQGDQVSVIAQTIKTLADRSIGSFKSVLRKISGVDHTQASQHSVEATELLSLRGRQSMVTARSDIRIDAERIHIG